MKTSLQNKHPVDMIFSLLLFGLFTLMLLMLLLFSAESYRTAVKGQEENQNLHTAMTYLTTKIRQHDDYGAVFQGSIESLEALCLRDTIEDQTFTTYIYLLNGQLKELFTVPDASVSAEMGTTIAELSSFEVEETSAGFLKLKIQDMEGNTSELLLHPTPPKTTSGKEAVS